MSVGAPEPTLRRYEYSALPSQSSFRILELLPGSETDDISCILHTADWNHPPQYEALSYAWGDLHAKVPINVENATLDIMPNLSDAFRRFRRDDSSRFLWADAVCIDQSTIVEKEHQVKNMRQIYSKASRILVWLGLDKSRKAELAAEAINEVISAFCTGASIPASSLAEMDDYHGVLSSSSTYFSDTRLTDSMHLDALGWYFSRSWFSRLWVFQEVNSGPDVLVTCGQVELSWDFVAWAAAIFQHYHPSRSLYSSLLHYAWHAIVMRARRAHREVNILMLLHMARQFFVTNSVDRVYAMLGLPPFVDMGGDLRVDYRKPKLEVYREIAEISLQRFKDLGFLSYVEHTDDAQIQSPSWVPMWDKPLLSPSLSQPTIKWNASEGAPMSANIDHEGSMLRARGVRFNTISEISRINAAKIFDSKTYKEKTHPLLDFWMSARPRHDAEALTASTSIVLIRETDILGRRISDPARIYADYAAYICRLLEITGQDPSKYPDLQERASAGDWQSYEELARNSTRGSSFFFTTTTYMGLASNAVRAGDVVCILFGGGVPFVLRQNAGYFQLVGEAYVRGIMDGEVIQQWRDGKLKDEVFEIR